MKKLLIISSYNESCGNASYTEALRKEFAKYYEVDIFPLKVDLLRSIEPKIIKLGNKHIDEICKTIKEYDYVNIQFEFALYGSNRNIVIKRITKLINASDNLLFTMHRVDIRESIFSLKSIKRIFANRRILMNLNNLRVEYYLAKMYEILAKRVEKMNDKGKKGNIIVHTKRDRVNIERIFGCHHVYDFPLTFLNKQDRERKRTPEQKKNLVNKYGLNEDDIVIGLFGFISEYKGHETAIQALKYLPKNYKILIFGSQHPMSITKNQRTDYYIKELMDIIDNNSINTINKYDDKKIDPECSLSNRVFFVGSLDDNEFIEALYSCDFAVLPYLEVNQSGSGIASLVLETKIKAIFSNNKAFFELSKYYPNTFLGFDIGNYQELAYKIKNYNCDFSQAIHESLKTYNIENNIKLQMSIFEGKSIDEKEM